MGLTAQSTGRRARAPDSVPLREPGTRLLALAGNPNVGKSTLFNALTNLHQHTGNWPGKTVACAQGEFGRKGTRWRVVDLPGTYSLLAHSAEEEVARDVLCFGGADAVVVVCDGTCLAHSLTLALQVAELCPRTVLCVNLLDEAAKKGIRLDLPALEDFLGIPVVGTSARSGRGLEPLLEAVDRVCAGEEAHPLVLPYPEEVERGMARILPALERYLPPSLPPRWAALRLLEGDRALCRGISQAAGREWTLAPALVRAVEAARKGLGSLPAHRLRDRIAASVLSYGEEACRRAVLSPGSHRRDRFWDRILTSRATGIPMMLLLLGVVLWLTIAGANGLSQLLAQGLGWIQNQLSLLLSWLNAPGWLHGALVEGVVQVVFWVVAVMLPPLAIFFPLFTLLE
ncbi:MAG TPA: 50S ribosome-binding GTPase, partial [Firmicutes bacterium]|nr:50S ribosome-binding GTPase [Bacillota bacterium]